MNLSCMQGLEQLVIFAQFSDDRSYVILNDIFDAI